MDQRRRQHSPVDRKIARNAATERRLRRASQDRPKPLDLNTSAKLRYLDDDDENDQQAGNQPIDSPPEDYNARRGVEMFEKVKIHSEKSRYKTQDSLPGELRLTDLDEHGEIIGRNYNTKFKETGGGGDEDEDEAEEETTASLEEVYLCSCCGVTKPLDPAMKYMGLFRGSFCLFNFLVFAFNFANLAMGLWFRIDPKVYEIHKYIETQNFTYAGYILLAGGLLGCLISLAGFAAAARSSTAARANKQPVCLLISYALTMTLLTVAFIGALVLLTVYGLGPPLERIMTKEIYEQMRRRQMSSPESGFVQPNENDATQFLDFVQVKLRCCGAQDWRDYSKLGLNVPTTCFTHRGNMIDAPGCGRALRQIFDVRAGLAAGTTAASVVGQLVAILLASLMVCTIYNNRAGPRPASAASYLSRGGPGGRFTPPTQTGHRVTTSPPPQLGLPV